MGVGKYNKIVAITDSVNQQIEAKDAHVGDMMLTDLSMGRIFFVDRSKSEKMLLSFTIKDSDNISQISVTYRHIMMKVNPKVLDYPSYPDNSDSPNSSDKPNNMNNSDSPTSDELRIPEILPTTLIEAKDLRVGDIIPRWAGGYGIIVAREPILGKSVQMMTDNGLLMVDKNILTCYVAPYSFCYYASMPVSFLSSISRYFVAKPFYVFPKMMYKRFLL